MTLKKTILLISVIIFADQVLKIYIKTHFFLYEEVKVFNWFKIHFIENSGMAWGVEIPGSYGKLILTVFRLLAIPVIAYWLWDTIKTKTSNNYLIVSIALILAGATGNAIDSVFYGVIFDSSSNNVATMFAENNYGSLLLGNVVDMFSFPFFTTHFPEWMPFWGGKEFTFFNAIFNIADASISVGVGILIVFNKRIFQQD